MIRPNYDFFSFHLQFLVKSNQIESNPVYVSMSLCDIISGHQRHSINVHCYNKSHNRKIRKKKIILNNNISNIERRKKKNTRQSKNKTHLTQFGFGDTPLSQRKKPRKNCPQLILTSFVLMAKKSKVYPLSLFFKWFCFVHVLFKRTSNLMVG